MESFAKITTKPELRVLESNEAIAAEAQGLRKEIVHAFNGCGGGHYGGSLSVIDVILTLYRRVLRVSLEQPRHPERDRFILSKGHAAMAYYGVLRKVGFLDTPLESYGKLNAVLEGHPEMRRVPGIDFSSGSLGQGLSIGLGMAIAKRENRVNVWVVLGDGECQEGQIWEAAMLASRLYIDNLYAIVDYNKHQEFGWNYEKSLDNNPIPQITNKWKAFGWNVLEVDGHDHEAMTSVYREAMKIRAQPTVVIAHTLKGKGVPVIEENPIRFHCSEITPQEQIEISGFL